MKRRSGKIFAATLALLVCLNAMPLGTLAAEGEPTEATTTEQQVQPAEQETPVDEPSADGETPVEEKQPVDGETPVGEKTTDDEQSAEEETPAEEQPVDEEEPGNEQPVDEETPADEEKPAEQEQPVDEDKSVDDKQPVDEEQTEESAGAVVLSDEATVSDDAANAEALAEQTEYYVNEVTGSDEESTPGTEKEPYKTLAKAMDTAPDGSTIYLLTDLTMTKMARVDEKSLTIDGQNHIIYRGDDFTPEGDQGRGGYNAEMIEVANGATLTLVNITLDDCNKREGTLFEEQKPSDNDGKNKKRVQDSIIAAYGDGAGTIILGENTILKNFGGMSAVRIGGNYYEDGWRGSTLIMKNGSRIIDDGGMGETGRQGGMAAVWSQGGHLEMETGSSISHIDGRAIYCDNGGTAVINGTISDITSNDTMVKSSSGLNNGFEGIAIYATPKTSVITLGETGEISNIKSHDHKGPDVAISLVNFSTFKMLKGSRITGIEDIGLIDCNGGTMDINGTISECHAKNVLIRMRNTGSTFKLGKDGSITKCSTTDAGIIYLNGGKPTIEISGTMSDIAAGEAIFISNNGSRQDGTCTLTETGVIKNVSGTAILAGDPSHVSISGEISDCGGYAVHYGSAAGSYVEIKEGATIQGNNKGGAQVFIKTVDNVDANDTNQHVSIAPNTLIDNQSVVTPFGTITLDKNYAAIGLGKASTAAVDEINKQVKSKEGQGDWAVAGNALWFQPSQSTLHFTVARPGTVEQGIGLHVAYIPLDENGNPANGEKVTLLRVNNRETIDVTLSGLTAGQSYALALVKESKYYVTINPVDITVYMGGEHGYEGVVSSEGKIEGSNSLPEPGFRVDLPKDVDPKNVTIRTKEQDKSWTFTPYNSDEDSGIYKIKAAKGQDPVRVQFTNTEGKVVVSDAFDVGTAVNQTLTMEIYKNNVTEVEAVKKDDVTSGTTYGVILNKGTLTVRGTTGKEQYGAKIEEEDDAQAGKPAFLAPSGVTFTINDSSVPANQNSIALLFDNIIENTNSETGRTALLTQKADEVLKDEPVPAGMVRNYQFKYLDLVDTSNGNAWVDVKDANDGQAEVTVCWPYPEGTNKDTEFAVLHFEDLHRDMAANDVANDIESSTVSKVNILKKTDTHIEFTTIGFSPFALAWNSPKPVPPVVEEEKPENDNDEGGTTTTPAATPAPTAQPAAQTTAAQSTSVIPQTSDESQPALWAGLLVFSGAVLAALYLLKRRKQNGER